MFAFFKMNIRNSIIFVLAIGFFYILSITGSGCAQIGMPLGGPRDSIPPVLLNANPPNQTTHFTQNKVVLTFDEYVHVEDLQNNLLVAPTPKINPVINYKLKTVTIKLRDTLQANTTYSIQLGNSIQDINENNPVPDFTYVFSTGAYIDSLTFSGNVFLAETGKVDTTLSVFLYKDLTDSSVYKHKPNYIARVNNKGDFTFHHLPQGTYNVFALKDESGQKIYNNPTQLFAFADSTIQIPQQIKSVQLFAFAEEKPFVKPSNVKSPAEKKLTFTNSLSSGAQDLLSPLFMTFSSKLKNFDSTKIKLTDTLFNPVNSATFKIDTTLKIVTVQNNWPEDTHYRLLIASDFATDTSGNSLAKADTLKFVTNRESAYGSIKINFKNLDKFKNPVLQFVVNNEIVQAFPIFSTSWTKKLFKPGDFELRILDDENKNGIWDPGNYHLKKQPEKVYSVPKSLNIRANWENEIDIIL